MVSMSKNGFARKRFPSKLMLILLPIGVALVMRASSPKPAWAAGALTAVWANDGGDKITQDELRGTNNATTVHNSVWNGSAISVFGARNETVSFNLVLEAANSAASNVSVVFNRLTNASGHSIISTPTTGDGVFNWVGRPIELFYVRYLQINGLSLIAYGTYDERQVPQRLERPWNGPRGIGTGLWTDRPDHNKYYPDIAVPLELVPSFTIASGQNQSIWVDIYIPKGTAPGAYTGNVTVSGAGNTVPISIPVSLQVYGFTLPDDPSSKTMLAFSDTDINYRFFGNTYINPASAQGPLSRQLRDRYFMVAHRHKIALIGDDINNCATSIDQPCPEWIPRLNGSLYSSNNGYDGPGSNTGNNVYSIGTYGTWNWQAGGQSAMNQHTDAWATWFGQNAAQAEYFLYLIDESPNTTQTEMWAQWIRSNPGPGQQLRSMATIPLTLAAAQTPSLDIPATTMGVGITSQWQPLVAQYTSSQRQRFFMYNGSRPASGSFMIEDDGTALRELPWGQYKEHINRWFYWQSTYYNNYQGGTGNTDLFHNAQTFGGNSTTDLILGRTGWNYANGDGVLLYPGSDVIFPANSYGVNGPFASLRLKHWRRGIQDVDYLTMAAAVNPTAVQSIVNATVPKAEWEYGVADVTQPSFVYSGISWSNDPNTWEAARAQLAGIIASALPPVPPAPPGPPVPPVPPVPPPTNPTGPPPLTTIPTPTTSVDTSTELSGLRVFPNPWRADRQFPAQITFSPLASNSTVKIFTLSGHLVRSVQTSSGTFGWDMTNDSGDKVASGVYVYRIATPDGQSTRGKLSIIR